ncbi:MAG: S41 family peptidase [Candidatus Nealsonbacteria bacterium]|nr:S41 family peptidase [Candidatus Nealsonbacteria bacterium]
MKFFKGISGIIFIFGIYALGAFSGYLLSQNNIIQRYQQPEGADFTIFWEAYNTLKDNYVFPDKINHQDIVYGAIAGMTNALSDPHTSFFTPDDTKRFLENTDGRFEGVGMEVDIRDNQFQVVAPLKGTPADKAGMMAGDKILKIDGVETDGLSVEEAIGMIRGPRGTKVVLTVLRSEWDKSREVEIIRDTIVSPSLEWELLEGNIAHISFYHFHRNTDSNFRDIALDLINSPAKGLILDLRNNSGGYLDVSQNIGGWFLNRGDVFVIEDDGRVMHEFRSKGNGSLSHYPLVVIMNQGSASASEILAGAVRYHNNALIVGETSFGKGSIQKLKKLRDGSSIKITIANWLTPNGYTITKKGLTPDYEVEMTIEDYEAGRDPQLDKAIEVMRGMI